MIRTACIAIVKNEEAHIAEWLAYQFALGFDCVIVLDNLSSDATKSRARAIGQHHDVRVVDWHVFTADYQLRGYEYAVSRFGAEFEWLGFFDTDEFLVFDPGVSLQACLQAREDAAALAVPWAMFGSSGHRQLPPDLVIESFLYRSPADFGPNRHIKTLLRPGHMRSCETAHSFNINGSYQDLMGRPVEWEQSGVMRAAPDYQGGKLHHYFTRSWAHWIAKLQRGYHDTKRRLDDFAAYDRNEIFDDSALLLLPAVKAILAQNQAALPLGD